MTKVWVMTSLRRHEHKDRYILAGSTVSVNQEAALRDYIKYSIEALDQDDNEIDIEKQRSLIDKDAETLRAEGDCYTYCDQWYVRLYEEEVVE